MAETCGFWVPDMGRVFDAEYAFDSETELIGADQRVPRFVIAGVCDGEKAYLLTRDNLAEFFRLHADLTVVMHNAAFDLAVVDLAMDGDYDIYTLVEEGRVRDTMILHRLYELATTGDSQSSGSSLADSCRKHLGIEVAKEEKDAAGKVIRTNFAPWIDTPMELPEEYIGYLVGDITATHRLYRRFQELYRQLCRQILRDRPFGFIGERHLHDVWRRFGPLTHDIQLKAAIVLDDVTRNGLRVDTTRLNDFQKELLVEQKAVLFELLTHGYHLGKGRLTALQRNLRQIEHEHSDIRFPRTETGKISTKKEYLEPYEDIVPFIGLYLRSKSLENLLSTFLKKMRKGTLHPTFDFLKNTGRTSAFGDISAQNLPRDERVRNLFISSPGRVYLDADYSAVEMATLAQSVLTQFGGRSAMAEAINSGADLHRLIAARVAGKAEADVDKDERQKAKAVNFGLPGGMGVRTLREYARKNYGVELSERETQALKDVWLDTFSEMRQFLSQSSNLGEDIAHLIGANTVDYAAATGQQLIMDADKTGMLGWMARKVYGEKSPKTRNGRLYWETECDYFWDRLESILDRLPSKWRQVVLDRVASKDLVETVAKYASQAGVLTLTGRLRTNATYCARHNTVFQGLAADGAKLAMWKLWRAGYKIVNFIHDEFLIELPEQDDYREAAKAIEALMIDGMKEVVPDVRVGVEYAVSRRWSKAAVAVSDDEGRLVPYEDGPAR